ncbi:MAG: hypothetical protein AMXMBFR59_41070 [Rhodanobacteraceae bacterium]
MNPLGQGAPSKLSYNLAEVVSATGVNRSAVYVALSSGALRSFKLGRRRMVSAQALQDWNNGLEKLAGASAQGGAR